MLNQPAAGQCCRSTDKTQRKLEKRTEKQCGVIYHIYDNKYLVPPRVCHSHMPYLNLSICHAKPSDTLEIE